MSEIKAGDLVMVVRPNRCCGRSGSIGRVFRVEEVVPESNWYCVTCGLAMRESIAKSDGSSGYPFYKLKKIDPSAIPEDTKVPEELTA